MRISLGVVADAAERGSKAAFDAIVRAYEGSLYALALSSTRSPEDAQDAVQDVFARVLVGLRDLRDPLRFEAWIFALARNELASRGRERAKAAALIDRDADPDAMGARGAPGGGPEDGPCAVNVAAEQSSAAELCSARLGPLFALLSSEQAEAVALRYGAGLSVEETALALGMARSVAKSRLHEALSRMKAAARMRSAVRMRGAESKGARRKIGAGFDFSGFRLPVGMEERIMENAELMRLGASVLERMALCDQARLATLAHKGEKMDAQVLEAMGKIEGGSELIRRTAARLALKELGGFLNYGDHYTEKRVVEELERLDPDTAEALKAGMFVFEDFVLCDGPALARIIAEAGAELFAHGLAGCGVKEREAILALAPPALQSELRAFISKLAFGPDMSRAAQQESISIARHLEQEGKLEVLRGDAAGPLGCVLRLTPRA